MNIFALIKRTFDTEEKIVVSGGKIQEDGAEFIINPYDEYAIEEAIQVRDAAGGKVTVVTIGGEDAEKQLRTALAMGADEAVLINTEDDLDELDQNAAAYILAEYLKDKDPDLILTGNVAIDGGSGQVGPRVADLLGINYVTTITKLEIDGTSAKIVRDIEGDSEVIETSLPGIMKAKKKPLAELELDDLDIDEDDVEIKVETVDIFLPAQKAAGRVLEGELSAQVKELVNLLHSEAKVV